MAAMNMIRARIWEVKLQATYIASKYPDNQQPHHSFPVSHRIIILFKFTRVGGAGLALTGELMLVVSNSQRTAEASSILLVPSPLSRRNEFAR